MILTTYVIDDEQAAITKMAEYIDRIPYLQLAGSSTNPIAAVEEIKALQPQIVFCDMDMPDVSGLVVLDAINAVNTWDCYFVIVSGHRDYAVEGYDRNVKAFLVKPCSFEKFFTAMEKARTLIKPVAHNNDDGLPEGTLIVYPVTDPGNKVEIPLCQISYIESNLNHLTIHYAGHQLTTRLSLKQILEKLPQEHFIKVHQSYIVSFNKVSACEKEHIILKDGSCIKIGVSYRDALFARMNHKEA
jgi:two-component system, LytTR family, response regulator